MHVLILPFQNYVLHGKLPGAIFQHQQAHTLKHACSKVGVLSAGFVPFRNLFDTYPYLPCENEDGVVIYRKYIRLIIPGRIANQFFYARIVDAYALLFEKYLLEQGRPDVMHAHNCLYAGLAALQIKRKHGIPYLITEHSTAFARGLISSRQAQVVREVLKNADVKTAVSTMFGRLLGEKFGSDAAPMTPIFNILEACFEQCDMDLCCSKREKSSFVFLNIARMHANKNQVGLLRAFANVFRGDAKIQLRIGGDGHLRKELEKQAHKLGVGAQVVFLGALGRDEVLRETCACDAFVLSSNVETFGVVLIEALACGKPVVATSCGGPEDIVRRNNGVLVPAGNETALADTMRNIYLNIDKYNSDQIRQDCLLRFGRDAFLARLLGLYQRIAQTNE